MYFTHINGLVDRRWAVVPNKPVRKNKYMKSSPKLTLTFEFAILKLMKNYEV